MQRQHPIFSPTGLVMTAVVLAVLAVVFWRTGGQMFSPGDLAAPHADVESCADCHQPLSKPQAELCMECHTEIREEIEQTNGLHARLRSVQGCISCHPDHRGEDFDLRAAAVVEFDHELTFFSLARHSEDYQGAPLDCQTCHTGDDYTPDLSACQACHEDAEPGFMSAHLADFGPGCLDCHDGADRFSEFNHSTTQFALIGEHSAAACAACHIDGQLTGLPLECAACHEEPAVHAGLFASTCEDCHSPDGWSPAALNGENFDHFTTTGFSLAKHAVDYAGNPLDCSGCHLNGLDTFEAGVCQQCHAAADPAFMTGHTEEFGFACLDCHDGVDAMKNFDHASVFVLDGAHAELDCTGCHVDRQFSGTPTDCVGCHAEPGIHAGLFGLNCQNCHTTAAWQPAAMVAHTFPLDHGGEGEIPCATCHVGPFVEYTCDACHEPAEMVREHDKEDIFDIAGRCVECHPTGLEDEFEREDD